MITIPSFLPLVVTQHDAREALRLRYHNKPVAESSPLVVALTTRFGPGLYSAEFDQVTVDIDDCPHIFQCRTPRAGYLDDYWKSTKWPFLASMFGYGPIHFDFDLIAVANHKFLRQAS